MLFFDTKLKVYIPTKVYIQKITQTVISNSPACVIQPNAIFAIYYNPSLHFYNTHYSETFIYVLHFGREGTRKGICY